MTADGRKSSQNYWEETELNPRWDEPKDAQDGLEARLNDTKSHSLPVINMQKQKIINACQVGRI